ncbi:MAG: prolyl oligopeptidase family serine peptidase [Myxococcaceae bacterium]|nr:prolyl oligopeptidase family serine peptidase [Myxococcaceae bacterium]
MRDRAVMLVHGLKDDRVTAEGFDLAARSLREAGASGSVVAEPSAGHFRFSSHREVVQARVRVLVAARAGW